MTETAARYNTGKPPLSYLLSFPNALRGFAQVCKYGEGKYARFNYLKGAPYSQYMDCLLRHLLEFYNGEEHDPESGCLHVDHVTWNALMLAEIIRRQPTRDDRPNAREAKA